MPLGLPPEQPRDDGAEERSRGAAAAVETGHPRQAVCADSIPCSSPHSHSYCLNCRRAGCVPQFGQVAFLGLSTPCALACSTAFWFQLIECITPPFSGERTRRL